MKITTANTATLHFTAKESGFVELLWDGTARILNVPWSTDRIHYLDRVEIEPSAACGDPLCSGRSAGRVIEAARLSAWVVVCQTRKAKNLRRLATALVQADPELRFASLAGSWEFRVATRLGLQELQQRVVVPFRVNIIPFYPGKIG